MCWDTPKAEAPKPPPPPAPPPAAPADVEFGAKTTKTKGGKQKTRQKLRTALKNPGVSVPGAGSQSGLNINKIG